MSHPQKKWRYQWEALYSGQTHVFVIPFVIFGGISAIQVTPSNYSLQWNIFIDDVLKETEKNAVLD